MIIKFFLKINTKNFGCESKNSQVNKNNLRICSVKTDANGKFSFTNIAYGKYKLSSSFSNGNLDFEMQPESVQADLTKNQDVLLSDPFLVSSVSIKSQALLGKNVIFYYSNHASYAYIFIIFYFVHNILNQASLNSLIIYLNKRERTSNNKNQKIY